MKIENLRTESGGGRVKIAATVLWEDCGRPAQELYFETSEEFAGDLTCNPGAFLLASAVPAMHYGEKRVSIDGEVCPELKDGLSTAMHYIRHWFLKNSGLPAIETKGSSVPPGRGKPKRAGFFFSGGIDSFSTLRANRMNYPPEHPLSIKDGIIVHGLELSSMEAFGHVLNKYSKIGADLGITLIPVYTNLYMPYRKEDEGNHFDFWEYEFMGTALSSVAHAFADRFSSVSISSTFCIDVPDPYGSHPLIDPNLSSTDLRIRHEGYSMSRLSKARSIADWDVVLNNLRVCNHSDQYKENILNCCRCEKCVRTMLEFMVLGVLDKADAFVEKDVPLNLIEKKVKVKGGYTELSYKELLEPLTKMGRHDLVNAIKRKLDLYRNANGRWTEKVKYVDDLVFNGNISRFRKHVSRVAGIVN
jgi:hypothetical protein